MCNAERNPAQPRRSECRGGTHTGWGWGLEGREGSLEAVRAKLDLMKQRIGGQRAQHVQRPGGRKEGAIWGNSRKGGMAE